MFAQLIFIVFISILATEYRKHSVCFKIQKKGDKNIRGATIDCDHLNKLDALDEVEIKICDYMQTSSDKCYYTKHYSKLMEDFLEGQKQSQAKAQAKAKIVEHAKIEKYGLVLCNSEKNHSNSSWPQFGDYDKEAENILDIQCKQGYLLDKNNYFDIHTQLCMLMGYTEQGEIDYTECPQYVWHYYEKFAYVCK